MSLITTLESPSTLPADPLSVSEEAAKALVAAFVRVASTYPEPPPPPEDTPAPLAPPPPPKYPPPPAPLPETTE